MSFTKEQRAYWWNSIVGKDVEKYVDEYGAIVHRDAKGNSDYAWDIDHIVPYSVLETIGVPEGLINLAINLRIINRHNNISKSDDFPCHTYTMMSFDDENNMKLGPFKYCFDGRIINAYNYLYHYYFLRFIEESRRKKRISDKRRFALNMLQKMGWYIDF